MRRVLSVSLPEEAYASLKKRAKKVGKSPGVYISHMVIEDEHMISEEELVERCREAEENYRNGNVKELTSFDELLKLKK